MAFRLLCTLAILLTAAPGFAQTRKPAPSGPPPLIDRELFFGNPEISGATISPDGKYIAFLKPWKETRNIWVKRTEDPYEKANLVTAETKRPIPTFFWSRDSRYILFVQDKDGDENYNVYAVNPSDNAAAGSDAPAARNVTDAKGARAIIYSVPSRDPDVIYIGLNDRDAAWHDLYRLKLSTGERTLMRKNTEKISSWEFDREGRLRLAQRTADNGDTDLLRVDDQAFVKVYSCNVFETCAPLEFHKDGKRVYMMTNRGDADLVSLVLFDPATSKEELVENDPLKRVDLGGVVFSDRTGDLIATVYQDDATRLYFKDKSFEADYNWLKKQLPGMELTFGSLTADERKWMLTASSDTEPGVRYLFDRDKKTLVKQYAVREKLPRASLASRRPVRYKSSDGLEIPGYLTLPRGVAPKNLPFIVIPHGGPWARDVSGYDTMAQFFANRGYAVLQPNFRSSTGYGKKFLNAGNNEWGQKMQDDLTYGVKHFVAQGIADSRRVAILGGSYGGYATLAGVAFTPDVYAAAVSIVGPSNLLTLLESIPPYWEAGRKMFHMRMGDPTTPEGKKQLERQSPLNSAAKIRTPLMVIQGANDPRVKKAESDQIVVALRDRGFPVEYIVAPDEGHGFQRPVNNLAMFTAIEKFLAKHLGGRNQSDATAEVGKRLTEITVDPKTVTLAKKVDASAVALPKPERKLETGTANYDAKIEVGGKTVMAMTIASAVTQENGRWVFTETAKTPAGDAIDIVELEPETLVARKRSISQGPMRIVASFEGGKATGAATVGGTQKPFDMDAGGPMFADGPSTVAVLGALPLKEGYTVTIRNFDLQKLKPALKQVTVAGIEDVTVPAGTFKAFKVEIKSAEGDPTTQTVWIDTATRKGVKMVATIPQANAVLTSELMK
jgi:dipeptidyl aminopeptidase/acylaminoacyl peptidase